MDLSDLGVGVARGAQAAMGGDGRNEGNKLPQKFIVYSWIPGGQVVPAHVVCHGWVEFVSVSEYNSEPYSFVAEQARLLDEPNLQNLVQWEVGNQGALESPLHLPQSCARSWKSVCVLEKQVETTTLRQLCVSDDSARLRAFRFLWSMAASFLGSLGVCLSASASMHNKPEWLCYSLTL